MSVIKTRELSKSYGDVDAVSELTFEVERGQLYGFIGPNGAGKTTTINILTSQLMPTSGSCTVLGVDPVIQPKKVRSKIGILPEREDPPSFMTPREYFEFVGKVRNLSDMDERVEEWAERLRFSDKLDVLNRTLSKGEKQKVMLTQAFIHSPSLAFIDEPLINLDPVIQEKFKEFLTGYVEEGNTVFLSTHVMSLADDVCSHIGILDKGRLVESSPMDELKDEDEKLSDSFLRKVGEI